MTTNKTTFNKYPAYKESGVEWLGEIPTKWEVRKISHLYNNIGSGTTPTSGIAKYYDKGKSNFLQTGDLNDGVINETSKKITEQALKDYSTLKTYVEGSLVIAMYGATIGKLGILNISTATNQACCVLGKSKKILTKFMFYSFLGFRQKIISLSYGGGQPNISQDLIKSLRLPFPPLPEQTAIANFLDEKTTKIDQAIAQKEQLIALLKERKQIIIQHAVTKGLDPNAKMKDSGVEWIGEIPAHWEVTKLKYYTTQIVDGTHFTPTYVESGVPFLRVTDISKKFSTEIDWSKTKYIPEKEHFELIKRANPKKGDVLLSKNGTIGITKVIDWDEEFSFFVSLCLLKLTNKLDPYFFCQFFDSPLVDKQIAFGSSRTSVTNLHLEKIKELLIVIPPIKEQRNLSKYLIEVNSKYKKIILLQQTQIKKLKEYKATLIDSAVTGKIKVI